MQTANITDANGNILPDAFWYIINEYFHENGLVKQQLSSYNSFITKLSKEVVPSDYFKFEVSNSDKLGVSVEDEKTCEFRLTDANFRYPRTKILSVSALTPLFPHEARIRNLTYSSELSAKVQLTERSHTGTITRELGKVTLGKIPVMLKSTVCRLNKDGASSDINSLTENNECVFDQGGYFIINGSEKVVIAQERMAPNTVLVFEGGDSYKYAYEGTINSVAPNDDSRSHKIRMDFSRDPKSTVKVPVLTMSRMDCDVPVILLFVALGLETDKEIMERICYDENDNEMFNIVSNALQSNQYTNVDDAKKWIGKHSLKSNQSTHEIVSENDATLIRNGEAKLKKDLLPHVGSDNFATKAQFLGYMTNHFLSVFTGKRNCDDRDHLARKRMQMTGSLMMDLFKNDMKKVKKNAQNHLSRCLESGKEFDNKEIKSAFETQSITDGARKALSTGNWPQPGGKEARHGVAQVLGRITFTSALSYLRKISSPVEGKRKTQKPRQLHNTQWGYICPAETPEGEQCGLVKMLSLMAQITVALPNSAVDEIKESLNDSYFNDNGDRVSYVDDISCVASDKMKLTTKVFLNGAWVKCTEEPQRLLNHLKDFRKSSTKGKIKSVMSMVLDHLHKELRIYTDAGRCTRPLFTVKKNDAGKFQLNLQPAHITEVCEKARNRNDSGEETEKIWKKILSDGLVEYVDPDEEEMSMIAMFPSDLEPKEGELQKNYTHCEINPALVMGIVGGIIPFPDHNQSPRNTYQCAMGKQAIGVYASNYQLRQDSLGHVLFYPQKPLVSTKAADYVKFGYVPAGINAIVAICVYSGYNQEDSVMMNQGSIDRGFFRSMSFKTFSDEIKKTGEDDIIFLRPNGDINEDVSKYSHLDVDGIINPGSRIRPDDILIAAFYKRKRGENMKDCSLRYKPRERGVIDQVVVTTNDSQAKLVKVKVRTIRIPQIGDKFSSRHGQKGTVGMTYRQEDMPFTIEGISPDIVMNPHAIPSRMTVGQLIECLLGKVAAMNGAIEDATPFRKDITVEAISKRLHQFGYQHHGYEALFSGHTGRKLDTLVYIGPTYYQRLKHLVDDKVHGRATGPYATLTRQPLEGRSRDGGLRLGEMERDCMISHGMSALLKERLFSASDKYHIYVCDICHMPAVANDRSKIYQCSVCKDRTHISKVQIPYAAKLLFQELMSMAICPRIYSEN
ncbi:DNA-directed RNA polymerase subunit beta [Entamoeba marina]